MFYRDESGREPVREFLLAQFTPRELRVIEDQIHEMNRLPENAPPLPFPQTSQIEGSLRELRCHSGSDLYRILHRRSGNLLILLHIIRKDRRTIPRRDIALAQRRWRDYKRRMDEPDRRGPRPAGRDAP